MKKNYFFSFFIALHIILIFLQVHKHTRFIKNNYTIQEYEKRLTSLTEKKELLVQELHTLKDRQRIKEYAYTVLNLRSYTLQQIKKL